MPKLVPSPQQQNIFDWVSTGTGSAIVEAVAGAGKTTTLLGAVQQMGGASVALVAYNKAIATELSERLAKGNIQSAKAGTFHSFGFSALLCHLNPKPQVDGLKVSKICESLAIDPLCQDFVKAAVSLAKQRAFGVLGALEDSAAWYDLVRHFDLEDKLPERDSKGTPVTLGQALALAALVLTESNKALGTVDFDDMIYLPLVLRLRVRTFDWLLVDEAQDTNPARRALAKKMLRPGGRLLAVGDRAQAIYGFTGADNDALETVGREFNCRCLPLTVSYRCPKAVVAHARQVVNHIEAAATAPAGEVRSSTVDQFMAQATTLNQDDVVLCRNTRPLVALAFDLIRRGIGCHVEGKDIGRSLLKMARRFKVPTIQALVEQVQAYASKEVQRLLAKGEEAKAGQVEDQAETLLVLCEQCAPTDAPSALKRVCDKVFGDSDQGPRTTVTLSTVHKSKGREWKRVYLWGRNLYMPSPYARQDWQVQQEMNLVYVAITRAQEMLVEVVVPPKPRK